MGVVDEDIAAVKAATDLVAIVGQYTQGKQVGRRWVGLCPFHAEKSPSFSVNREDGLFMCFGCQKSGDAITFVREIEHLDFVGAVEWLAARAGVTLRYTTDDEGETRKKRKRLHDAMEKAVDWYHDRLLTGPDAGAARGYLRSRGFDGETVRRYRLGWAPAAWDELVRGLRLPEDVLVDTGLGFKNRTGRSTDAFRGRLLFPIFDAEGKAVAIGGRILPGDDGPKYKNSPETELYSKSRVLYGLNWHKSEIVGHGAAGEVIVCEGYTDVIGFARAGIPRAVATCGTALTEDHVKLLTRFAKRIVLAFDADAAGQGAADRFAAWESRYELEVCVADLPAGPDPGDLAQRDPDRLRAAVDRIAEWRPGPVGAKPYLAFRLDRVLAAADLGSVEGRARAATAGVDVLRDHPNELVRDAYLMKLADFCRVDVEQLRRQLPSAASTGCRRWCGAAAARGRPTGHRRGPRGRGRGPHAPRAPPRRDAAVAGRRALRRRPPPRRVLGAGGRARRRPRSRAAGGHRPRGGRGARPRGRARLRRRARRRRRPPPRAGRRAAPRRAAGRGPGGRRPARPRRADGAPPARPRGGAATRPASRRVRPTCWPSSGTQSRDPRTGRTGRAGALPSRHLGDRNGG